MFDEQPAIIQSEYREVVRELDALTRTHEKTYRLTVGGLILQRFFAGQPALYQSRDHNKETKFSEFLELHAEDLAQLDLNDTALRRCVRVRICYDLLPPTVRDRIGWTVLVVLSTLPEVNQRARLAIAAADEGWTVARTREVVEQARQGRVWDTDKEAEGLQLPEPEPERGPQPGRLVTRTEKWGEDIGAWHEEFARVDPKKLTKAQVARMRSAMGTVRGQLDALEKLLPA